MCVYMCACACQKAQCFYASCDSVDCLAFNIKTHCYPTELFVST